ncbi:MAG: lipoyl synthase [Nitrososphaerota archaeon]|nr:lipoyl synthase [Nitrososphaerota archaeon]
MHNYSTTPDIFINEYKRKPSWLKVKLPSGEGYNQIQLQLRRFNLHTVCEEALCPNICECWNSGTLTFMLMGDTCTRSCRFCNVKSGDPGGKLDPSEPMNVAKVVEKLRLKYVVLTSVDRDDIPDGGAGHFAETIRAIKGIDGDVIVEALIPDFQYNIEALRKVVEAGPDVIGHNIETVERLSSKVRDPRASYRGSLNVLRSVKMMNPKIYTKSSLMLGLGEREDEVLKAMRDLREAQVDILTLGQYLQPSKRHLPVVEYVHPERFEYFKKKGEELGFLYVASNPLVRSSYKSIEYFSIIKGRCKGG